MSNDFALVHNGVISNYTLLKDLLLSKGYSFFGSTDSEILVNMVDYLYHRSKKDNLGFISI